MKKITLFLMATTSLIAAAQTGADKTIFAYGGGFNKVFNKYIVELTHKSNPKICFIPTASADNANSVNAWYASCVDLPIRPYVLWTFIASDPRQKSFEEILLDMDAIIVGGGNTLNMMAIWKAQGIDTVLKKAYDKGIVLAGGSAGSLCWFKMGSTDSRPKALSTVEGLGLLDYSHCPHYHSEPARRPMYQEAISSGKFKAGYACDDLAGIVFVNGMMKSCVSQQMGSSCFFVSVSNGAVKEEILKTELIK